jgi:DNA polymerase III subunit beta
MKFSTTKERLLDAVLVAEHLVGKREALPILSCILFDASGKMVVLHATNLEAGVDVTIPGEGGERGVVAVPAAVLSQTIRSIGGDKVTIRTEEGNLIVESKGSKTLIKAIPHEEFPTLTGSSQKKGVVLPREQLMRSIQAVSYAASPSMIRPELGSIYVSLRDGKLVCVATDSFRLAEKIVGGEKGKEGFEVLIPLKHALELTRVLERVASAQVALSADESQLTVTGDGIRFVSRVVEGTFPNYGEIIPKSFSSEATVLKNDLGEMLKKARVFSGGDQHVGLHLYPKKKIFTATARSSDVGEMSDSIDAALSGEDLDINFHIGYLSDCLSSVESDSVTLGFAGAGKPLVIRGVSDASFTYLVMPLNR